MIKAWHHFITITRHRNLVVLNCFKAGIGFQGLFHDLSKYTPVEFMAGCRYFQGDRSPLRAQREDIGYSEAWIHHKGRNRHHFEYWTDYDKDVKKIVPVKMPLKYVKEMFCDRVAAGKIYLGSRFTQSSPLEFFLNAKPDMFIHPETLDLLERFLYTMAEKGEAAAFELVRSVKEY